MAKLQSTKVKQLEEKSRTPDRIINRSNDTKTSYLTRDTSNGVLRTAEPSFSMPDGEGYVPGEVIVQFKNASLRSGFMATASITDALNTNLELPENLELLLSKLRHDFGLESVHPIFAPADLVASVGPERLKVRKFADCAGVLASVEERQEEWSQGFTMLSFSSIDNDKNILKILENNSSIKVVERMPARWLATSSAAIVADPMINRQWGLRAIDWFGAERNSAGEIAVAVLDSGIDQTHPDLQNVIKLYQHFNVSPDDIIGHGTHVAGTIAARANNGLGVSGIADCQLYIWKIFKDQAIGGKYYVDSMAYLKALEEVLNSGAKILNLSVSGTNRSVTEELLFKKLSDADVAIFAAMGNEFARGNPTCFPAAYPNVYAVGAIEETGQRAAFSNTGSHIFIAAPGMNILSTLPTKPSPIRAHINYEVLSGTSMATPHVAGIAALIRAKFPKITAKQTAERLAKCASLAVGMVSGSQSPDFGAGIVNAKAALENIEV